MRHSLWEQEKCLVLYAPVAKLYNLGCNWYRYAAALAHTHTQVLAMSQQL